MNARQLRLVRAAAVSATATVLAAVSHTVGGGSAPHPLLVLAVATVLTPLSAVLVGSAQSRGRVAATVLVSQGVFHLLFHALGSPTNADVAGGAAHSHHVDLTLLAPVAPVAPVSALMLVAHLVAAMLTTVLIWHGEALVATIIGWVEALFRRAAAVAPIAHRRPSRPHPDPHLSFLAAVTAAVPRRGPPVLVRG